MAKLIPIDQLDQAARADWLRLGIIALDAASGANLRKTGKNRYMLSLPGYAAVIIDATTDQAAIDQANRGRV